MTNVIIFESMKSKFAFTGLLLTALFLSVGSLSHAAKTTHVFGHELISVTADLNVTSSDIAFTPAILAYEIVIEESRPLVAVLPITKKSVSDLSRPVFHRARDSVTCRS